MRFSRIPESVARKMSLKTVELSDVLSRQLSLCTRTWEVS